MSRFHEQLGRSLEARDASSMRRSLRALPGVGKYVEVDGRRLLNLASNDYLGLATHGKLKTAAQEAVEVYGAGSTASRLVTGTLAIHDEAEQAFAKFKHAEAALLFVSGYTANLAVLNTLAKKGDLICIDKLTHASLIDAAQASAADVRTYPHLDLAKLEQRLKKFRAKRAAEDANVFIVTDSVFSMDGDCADLPGLCALAEKYEAVTVVDEAHGTGVLGETGAGLAEAQGASGKIDVTISTASKALGGLGGIVTGQRVVTETLVNEARSFIYTTAPPPAQAATLLAALGVLRDEPERRERLGEIVKRVREAWGEWLGAGGEGGELTPIVPLMVGEAGEALALAERLAERGILGVAIRPPTVAPGSSRVRLCLRADLEDDEVDHVIRSVRELWAAERSG